jgi:L-aspartate oxidase
MSERYDLIVIGTGASGLATALSARGLRVALISKGVLGLDGNSCWASAGIAAPLASADSTIQFAADTQAAGYRAGNKLAMRWMVESAMETAQWLSALGVQWDRTVHGVVLSQTPGHSVPRNLRATADASGSELMRAMRDATARAPFISGFDFCEVERIIKMDARAAGVQIRHQRGQQYELYAPQIVLATGGIGQLYRHTTNALECDGSGLALAHAAGASLDGLELVQFHGTVLASRQAEAEQLPVVSDAIRGAGARLVNDLGVRFLASFHEQGDFAPSDVVARAVQAQMDQGHEVFVDARTLGDSLRVRFPTLFAACQTRNIDPRLDLIPVIPAQHFHIGGVRVDMHSATSIPGLYAVGEVAHTGVHGANRLSGNALLEAISFGRTLGERLSRQGPMTTTLRDDGSVQARRTAVAPVSESLVYNRLRHLMSSFVGVTRSMEGLQSALEQIALLEKRCLSGSRALNQLLVAKLIAEAALQRKQSLGVHHVGAGGPSVARNVAQAS